MIESHEAIKGLDGILPDTASEELRKWWDKVLMTAKEFCNDPEGRLISFDLLLALESEMKAEDIEKGRDCMKRALELHLKSMPNISGELFMQIIKNLESKK
jgi:hypothetical protein